ncbi:MAG TPA: error-prone DNA polymerase [Chthoniobacteraceae bacterium]|nr:error-prone DNA polymerase [Chthoniobacteraceae bacterium]
MIPRYIELHARSAFSFLRGGAFPEELAECAAELGLPAMAVCDRDGVYGTPRFHKAAKEAGIKPIVGAELTLDDGSVLPVLVASRAGYKNLCRLITRAKLRGTKEHAPVKWTELAEFSQGLVALTGDEEGPVRRCIERDDHAAALASAQKLIATFGKENVFVEVQRHLCRGEEFTNDRLFSLAETLRLPALATNGPIYARPEQRRVLDVFTCARNHTHLDAAGRLLSANDERYLKSAAQMARLFADRADALENSARLAERLDFTLEKLGYQFPSYDVPRGETMDSYLHKMTMAGVRTRYTRMNARTYRQVKKELALIQKLGFSGYFPIVWDIINFCREHDILVQGRGSAANSVVCYALGITACDPIAYDLLFERFLTETRETWPDIDLDLPSGDKRESVIQEIYRRYSPNGAAMTANVITFRGRSAMREIGKALNFSADTLDRFSKLFGNGDFPHTMQLDSQLRQAGMPPEHPRTRAAVDLYKRIYGLPRHLGQHSGGMIIYQGQLDSIVPLENASMPGRVVAQWDKDDCEDLKIIKVDFLGLGMMAALHETFQLCAARGHPVELHQIPSDDAPTYDLMCAADTIGTFQVESRAQMATLPRLKPRRFYDVAIQVAIIRPGPIEGGMLNSYLARRMGKEEVTYYDDRLKKVLGRTLGIPLFQEQLLKMSMVMADFSGSEAEELRRALSFHRSQEKMNKVCIKLRASMERKQVAPDVIEKVIQAVQSFAVYGFPESHAISFALLAYASCWLKVHRAPEFYTALLNNQPMGFYSPDTLVKDARRRGVRTLHVCVRESQWFCTIGADGSIRLGLCYVRGIAREEGARILQARDAAPFASLADFQLRTRVSKSGLRTLARTGALNCLAQHRRVAQWQVETARDPDDLFAHVEPKGPAPLAPMTPVERTQSDYSGTGLTTGSHPMALIRGQLPSAWRAADLVHAANGALLQIAGMVICRQRPGTAKGFVFISLEDETGVANAVVTPQLFEKQRLRISEEPFLEIEGLLQNVNDVIHVKATRITPLKFGELASPASHDFR